MMKNRTIYPWMPLTIAIIGTLGTFGVLVARVVLMPWLRDADTGRFSTNVPAMILIVLTLAAMALLAALMPRNRIDVPKSRAVPSGLAGVLAGLALGACALFDAARYLFGNVLPAPSQAQTTVLTNLIICGFLVFGALGAVALVRWGLLVVAESGTRRGMSAFGALAPVMWAWCRLAWYEMSYASTIGWSEKFYDFLMVILELLFLFKFARFVSGVGKTTSGEMLFLSMATAVLSLSGPLTRVLLYFTGGAEAYLASELAGLADVGIGVLALALGWSLVQGCRENSLTNNAEEAAEDDDGDYDSSLDRLFVLEDNEASQNNRP